MAGWTYGEPLRSQVRGRLGTHVRQAVDDPTARAAAVTITIVAEGDHASCLLTRRAAKLRAHTGQYALPGGRLEPGEDAVTAALRELHEEVGVDGVEVLGLLDDYRTRSGYVITPVVVWAPRDVEVVADPSEVAVVHHVPLAHLAERAPRFIEVPDARGPIIQLPIAGTLVHAPTGALLHQFAEVVLHGRSTRVGHFDEAPFARR